MLIRSFFAAALLCAAAAHAADVVLPLPQGTIVELSAEASREAANDLAQATVFAEAAEANPRQVAQRVNAAIAAALATARGYPAVKAKSGATHSNPLYGKDGRTIERWRMRSDLQLESRDAAALGELLGKLQASGLGVAGVALQPAPETRRKAEDQATLDALAAFQSRAKLLADALGKPYRLKQVSVSTGGRPPMPLFRAAPMVADAAPMPVEAGESSVTVTVNGQIELQE